MKKRCTYCHTLTEDWEVVGGILRCWPCGKRIREAYGANIDFSGGWNYRVCKTTDPVDGDLYSIKEVYYDKDGKPEGFCVADVQNWESLEDLKGTLTKMLQAVDKPVLND